MTDAQAIELLELQLHAHEIMRDEGNAAALRRAIECVKAWEAMERLAKRDNVLSVDFCHLDDGTGPWGVLIADYDGNDLEVNGATSQAAILAAAERLAQ